jgi:hypothetical protein
MHAIVVSNTIPGVAQGRRVALRAAGQCAGTGLAQLSRRREHRVTPA